MNVIECAGLGRRYRRRWALRDCTLAVPAGRVVALVGPNGAGKTTLLQLAVGLLAPTTGRVRVLGGEPAGSPAVLDRIGFLAQDAALYRNMSVRDLIRYGRGLNRRFDAGMAAGRVAELGIDPAARFGRLSGGQQAQVALALVLAKRPDLLILDEPMARLDPLARHEFLAAMLSAAADGLSVVFSSHVVAELERACDHLIVLSAGRVQVAGDVETLLAGHSMLTGPTGEADRVARERGVVADRRAAAQAHLLVRDGGAPPTGWRSAPVGLEDLVLGYLREPAASALPGPRRIAPEKVVTP